MYVVKYDLARKYVHKDGQIILFENHNEAKDFIKRFHFYCTSRLQAENRIMDLFTLENIMQTVQILEKDFKEEPKCGTITYREVLKSYER